MGESASTFLKIQRCRLWHNAMSVMSCGMVLGKSHRLLFVVLFIGVGAIFIFRQSLTQSLVFFLQLFDGIQLG